MDLKFFSEQRAEDIARAASEIKWRQTMLNRQLKNLRQCVSPRLAKRLFCGGSEKARAETIELILSEMVRDLAGLLRGVNDARVSAKEFTAAAQKGED